MAKQPQRTVAWMKLSLFLAAALVLPAPANSAAPAASDEDGKGRAPSAAYRLGNQWPVTADDSVGTCCPLQSECVPSTRAGCEALMQAAADSQAEVVAQPAERPQMLRSNNNREWPRQLDESATEADYYAWLYDHPSTEAVVYGQVNRVDVQTMPNNSFRVYCVLNVFKTHKGSRDLTELRLISPGGSPEHTWYSSYHEPQCQTGDVGIFYAWREVGQSELTLVGGEGRYGTQYDAAGAIHTQGVQLTLLVEELAAESASSELGGIQ